MYRRSLGELIDMLGMTVMERVAESVLNRIEFSELQTGSYILRTSVRNEVRSQQISIIR